MPITEHSAADLKSSQHREDTGVASSDFATWRPGRQSDPKDLGANDWVGPFQTCAINFRLRRYDALLRCLDDVDRGIAAAGNDTAHAEVAKRYFPVLAGWLRANAYAELGQPEIALQWAARAWQGLPEEYQRAEQPYPMFRQSTAMAFEGACRAVAGGWRSRGRNEDLYGRNNPAALDMRAETVAMSLEAELALLYGQLGQEELSRQALERLRKWRDAAKSWNTYDYHTRATADLLSIGPLFAFQDYAAVVQAYEAAAGVLQAKRQRQEFAHRFAVYSTLGVGPLLDSAVGKLAGDRDARAFSVALEDVANALIYAKALAALGYPERARKILDTLLQEPGIGDMGSVYWSVLYVRGQLALADGERAAGIAWLRRSIDALERTRATISYEAAKIGFSGDKQQVYGTLVDALAETADWPQVFEVVERAKARALVDLLAQQRDVKPAVDADGAVRKLLAQVGGADTEAPFGSGVEASKARGEAYAAASELAARAPELASLLAVRPVPLADIAVHLASDEALVDYYRTGNGLYALVLRAGRVTGFKLSATGLEQEVRAYRNAIAGSDPEVVNAGRTLYERLLRPLEGELPGRRLTLSPHGILHYLPFAALWDGTDYLADRYVLRILPSATTLVYLRTEPSTQPGKLLALGDPDLGNPQYDLPHAQEEARDLAAMFPASKALLRGEASKSAFRALGGGFSMLHFATHGVFDADAPLNSGLLLAKGSEASGRLTVSDLYGLSLDADLVTLSACETGLGKVANGDDVIGLTRGFLHAGARSIVASLWKVDDASTKVLMLSFYRQLHGHDKGEALQLAEIETRRQFSQPRYWAAFELTGSLR